MTTQAAELPSAPAPPPRVRLRTRSALITAILVAGLLVVHVIAWRKTEISISAFVHGYHGMVDFLSEAWPPDLSHKTLSDAISGALITLWMALLGTTFALPLALVLSIPAARTTSPNAVTYQVARSILSFLRAVPDVVFALIFVTAVGLGPFPGVLALTLHTIGVLGKLFSEAIEEMDTGPVEALTVAGASRVQTVQHAVLPTVLPTFVGLTLYRFDVNVRSSLVLGLVGAGGIGFLINQSIQEFRFDTMLTDILVVLVLVVAADLTSAIVRRRLQ
jgi:phosphonate transport system permease protein